MGKSRKSPLSRTASTIGVAGSGGITQNVQSVALSVQQSYATVQVSAQDLVDASKIASIYGNDTADKFAKMSDRQLVHAIENSQEVDMPDHIADIKDATQQFTYANKLNAKPTVLDSQAFDKYIKDNHIHDTQVLAREVDGISFTTKSNVKISYTSQDVADTFRAGDINYIGGKHGGKAYGAGTYFANVGINGSTGYGGSDKATIRAVLSKKAKCICSYNIDNEWNRFERSKPALHNALKIGRIKNPDISIKALLMGYNVITSYPPAEKGYLYGTYFNVIDRSAIICRAD